jgi:hypothetical protein
MVVALSRTFRGKISSFCYREIPAGSLCLISPQYKRESLYDSRVSGKRSVEDSSGKDAKELAQKWDRSKNGSAALSMIEHRRDFLRGNERISGTHLGAK